MKTAKEYYLEHFHTLNPPKGIDVLGKDYDYRELIGFAEDFANEKLKEAAKKATAKIIVKSAGPLGVEDMAVVDKESILSLQIKK